MPLRTALEKDRRQENCAVLLTLVFQSKLEKKKESTHTSHFHVGLIIHLIVSEYKQQPTAQDTVNSW